jgi:hypothetical protein
LTRLRPALSALDDEALAALANKGLVRRARKDLEQSPGEIVAADDEGLKVRVGAETVDVPASPVQASCTCPAGGVCRHILAALILLRETAESTPPGEAVPSPDAAAELAALDDETLQRLAGKPLVRRAAKALGEGLKVEFDAGPAIAIRFPTRNVVCRWVPGGGLAGMICTCQAADVCEHRVAAVLAWQRERGLRTIVATPSELKAAAEAPRTRQEVLGSVNDVLGEMFGIGLARLSKATRQRLETLAVSCHGIDLPRLERWLAALAEAAGHSLRRDARASTMKLLEQGARVAALAAALANPTARLVGRHRTRYEQVGNLSLVGLGAERWRSESGYAGLTVYFWDEALGNWSSWTDARPAGTPGFDPLRRYHGYGPWSGCSTPAGASRSRLQLSGAWRNQGGRLSGRPSTRAAVLGDSDPRQVSGAIADWSQLAERARRLFGGGLGERNEQDELVALRPALWLPAQYNEVRQELVRIVLDEKQRPLPLVVRFTPETASAVRMLEQHDATNTHGLLGRLRLAGGRLWVEPISLFADGGMIHLTLDDAAAGTEAPAIAGAVHEGGGEEETLEEEEGDEISAEFSWSEPFVGATPLGALLMGIESELEAIAESGTAVRRDLQSLEQAVARLKALGLSICAAAIGQLVEKLRAAPQAMGEVRRAEAAAALLRTAYLVRLAMQEESLANATAGFAASERTGECGGSSADAT